MVKQTEAKTDCVINPKNYNFYQYLTRKILMLSKSYASTEIDRRNRLHVLSGTLWSISSGTRQVVEIYKETSTKMYTPKVRNINPCLKPVYSIGLLVLISFWVWVFNYKDVRRQANHLIAICSSDFDKLKRKGYTSIHQTGRTSLATSSQQRC